MNLQKVFDWISKDVGGKFCWNDSAELIKYYLGIILSQQDIIENDLEVRVFTTRQTSSEYKYYLGKESE